MVRGETFLIPEDKMLLLYDGDCGLCNRAVQWLLQRDRRDTFRFCALQSATAKQILESAPPAIRNSDSIILYAGHRFFHLSTAALKAAAGLGGKYRLLSVFLWIPAFLRDSIYRFIARNRKRWWPYGPSCALPRQPWQHKFID